MIKINTEEADEILDKARIKFKRDSETPDPKLQAVSDTVTGLENVFSNILAFNQNLLSLKKASISAAERQRKENALEDALSSNRLKPNKNGDMMVLSNELNALLDAIEDNALVEGGSGSGGSFGSGILGTIGEVATVAGIGAMAYGAYKHFSEDKPTALPTSKPRANEVQSPNIKEPTPKNTSPLSEQSYSSKFAGYLSETIQNVNKFTALFPTLSLGAGLGAYVGDKINDYFSGDEAGQGDASKGAGSSGNARIAIDYFISQGYTLEQAAGIVGALQQESTANLNPNAYNSAGGGRGAHGIAQWRGSRLDNFAKRFNRPLRGSSLQQQLEFIQWEMNNTHKDALTAVKRSKTASQAAVAFESKFEKAGEGAHHEKRMANAEALVQSYKNENAQSTTDVAFNMLNTLSMVGDAITPGARSGKMGWPLSSITVTSKFGMRKHPKSGQMKLHAGVDFRGAVGTPVFAADDGLVEFAAYSGAAGNLIILAHERGVKTKYMHLSKILVQRGIRVRKGQLIGNVGSTGKLADGRPSSTGPHLHFGVYKNGSPVDPMQILGSASESIDPGATEPGFEQTKSNSQGQQIAQDSTENDFVKRHRQAQAIHDAAAPVVVVTPGAPKPANKPSAPSTKTRTKPSDNSSWYTKYFGGIFG